MYIIILKGPGGSNANGTIFGGDALSYQTFINSFEEMIDKNDNITT